MGAALVTAAPVAAHSLLIASAPAANSTVESPGTLVLRFNNRIEKKLSRMRLVGAGGDRIDLSVAVTGRADTLTASVPALLPGAWRVEWQVLSTDGHVVSGTFAFSVGPSPRSLSPAPSGEPEAGAALLPGRGRGQPR